MPFEKGHKLSAGRPLGSINKIGAEIRELITEAILPEIQPNKIREYLENVEDSKKLEVIIKLLQLILPRMQSVEADVNFSTMTPEMATQIIKNLIHESNPSESD